MKVDDIDILSLQGAEDLWKGLEMKKGKGDELVGLTRGSLLLKVYVGENEVIGVRKGSGPGWWCEVYKAGIKDKPLARIETFPIELDLTSDMYDFRVHYKNLEVWLNEVAIEKGKIKSLTLAFNEQWPAGQSKGR